MRAPVFKLAVGEDANSGEIEVFDLNPIHCQGFKPAAIDHQFHQVPEGRQNPKTTNSFVGYDNKTKFSANLSGPLQPSA